MKIITEPVSLQILWESREYDYIEMMKIVVDVEQGILAIDADMHADLEQLLLDSGSTQQNLWGANVYPEKGEDEFLEYTSFINIRPSQGNRSMEVQDPAVREQMTRIAKKLLK
jgi:hypothetical protein